MQDGIGKIFGGGGSGDKPSIEGKGPSVALVGILLFLLLGYEMVYRIDPAERGVVMRFGKYVTSLQPGSHIRFPRPIEQVVKVNVERIQTITKQAYIFPNCWGLENTSFSLLNMFVFSKVGVHSLLPYL